MNAPLIKIYVDAFACHSSSERKQFAYVITPNYHNLKKSECSFVCSNRNIARVGASIVKQYSYPTPGNYSCLHAPTFFSPPLILAITSLENLSLSSFLSTLGNAQSNEVKSNSKAYSLHSIGHIGKYHNILCLSPQILHKHCFQFLLGLTMVPRENKNNAYAKFGGTNKEYYGIFRNGLY